MTHDPIARLFAENQASKDELFVHMGMGPEENGLRVATATEHVENQLYRFLDTVGDGTGTKTANADYSVTAAKFRIKAPVNKHYVLYTMTVHIEDNAALTLLGYGASVGPLSNGIDVYIADANENDIFNLTDDVKIKSNPQWMRVAGLGVIHNYGGASEHLTLSWDFERSGSALVLRPSQSLVVALNDDFSHLTGHTFFINGHLHDT
jgi:hypothetical protein